MDALRPNLVQAEFFHIPQDVGSVEEVMSLAFERAMEGSRIKTVVRFFDEDGSLTAILYRFLSARKRLDDRIADATHGKKPTFFSRLMNLFRKREQKEGMFDVRSEARQTAATLLRKIADTSREIGVECRDYSFRLADPSELHELVESAEASTDIWLFIFEPVGLLDDHLTSVDSIM